MGYEAERLISANIILTNNCNSKCGSCDYWKKKVHDLDLKSIKRYYNAIKRYDNESIVLTGGEPTLHPDFYEIVKIAKQEYGFIIILSTNGSTLSSIFDKVYNWIDSYCISFDGCSRQQYYDIRGIDNYDNILKNIDVIKSYNENIQIWLSCLIQKKNFADIEKLYDVAVMTKADGIFFNVPELKSYCFGRENEYIANKELLIEKNDIDMLKMIFNKILDKDNKRGFLCQSAEVFQKFIEYFSIMNGNINLQTRKCHVPYNTITLTEYGRVKPCFYIDYELELKDDPVNCTEMINLREMIDNCPEYQKQCNYCGQFNS